jgi:hypothetical protein
MQNRMTVLISEELLHGCLRSQRVEVVGNTLTWNPIAIVNDRSPYHILSSHSGIRYGIGCYRSKFPARLVRMLNEHTIRIFMATATLIGVPVLLLFAVWKWIGSSSRDLPHWRSGVGLTALLFTMSGWLWCFLAFKGAAPTDSAQVLIVALWSLETSVGVLLAPVLSLAWKHARRNYLLAATVLLFFGSRAFYYV